MKQLEFARRPAFHSAFRLIAKALHRVPRTGPLAVLCLAALTLGVMSLNAETRTNEWVWLGGGGYTPTGIYGALGVPAAGNVPGGRMGAVSWIDTSGNLWLFGGHGLDSYSFAELNDLWEFNPSTSEWTWVAGSNRVSNPGVGEPGVYGTLVVAAAGNVPGGRDSAVSWTDASGNLWLFGGHGFDSVGNIGELNDLWEFNPATREWAWMGGSSTVPTTPNYGRPGVYGTLGVPAAGNVPGGRDSAVSWTDASGNLWLFGGWGLDSVGNVSNLNDLWVLNPSTYEWAWMGWPSRPAPPRSNCATKN